MKRILVVVLCVSLMAAFSSCGSVRTASSSTPIVTVVKSSKPSATPSITPSATPSIKPSASPSSKPSTTPSTSPSAAPNLSDYKNGEYVVFEDARCTFGKNVWKNFYNDVCLGKSASVKVATYYTLDKEQMSAELYEEEKDKYPQLFITDLNYDGSKYTVMVRMSTEVKPEDVAVYPYLKHYTGEANTLDATFSTYDFYVLVNDDSVTWPEIEHGNISSQMGDYIDHKMVYMDFID